MACKPAGLWLCHFLILPHRFRWVYCQLEVLRHSFPSSVRQILAELPESLDGTYERILQQLPKSERQHTHRLLQCLTVAVRPLRLKELAEVLAVDFSKRVGIPKLDESLRWRWEDQEQAVLSACSSLITVVEDRRQDVKTVHFSHFSVKEFLTLDRLSASTTDALRYHHIRLGPAHTIMAQACLSVLLHLTNDMNRRTIRSYHLAECAGKHFHNHASFEDVISCIIDGVDDLLDPEKPHFDMWLWLQIGDWDSGKWHNAHLPHQFTDTHNPGRRSWTTPMYPPRVTPLYYVAAFGHICLAQRLILTRPQDLQVRDNQGCTPLHIAVLSEQLEASKLLIRPTADLDILDIEDHNILHMVAYKAHLEITRVLLAHSWATKAHINARNKNGQTPLHLASQYHDRYGHRLDCNRPSIAALLLKFGADVDAQDNDNMTPLHCTIEHSTYSGAVKMLIEMEGRGEYRRHLDPLPLESRWQPSSVEASFYYRTCNWTIYAKGYDNMTLLVRTSEYFKSGSAAQLLLERGASVHTRNKDGRTPLHLASKHELYDVVALLIKFGADVNAQDNNNMTPLHCAIDSYWSFVAAQLILDHGANIHLRDKNGQTPLHLASRRGLSDVVALLLKEGAKVNQPDNDNMTPLLCTSGDSGDSAVSQLLLEHGASVNVRNKDGQTPLHLSHQGSPDVVALLLKSGLDANVIDNDRITPLLCALNFPGHRKVAQVLLEHGASVNVQDKEGKTPLHLASHHGFSDVVASLFKLGASVNVRDKDGQTPLHLASRRDHSNVVALLLKSGADMDALDNDGINSLLCALKFTKYGQAGKVLLENGASVRLLVRDENGQTPLHLAFQRRRSWLIPLLIKSGADVDVQDNDGMTPLLYAVKSEPTATAQLLLEHGASVHLRNKNGLTPLPFAVGHSYSDTVALLLQFGAPVDAQDDNNITPLCTSTLYRGGTNASMLLQHGASVHTQNKNGQTPLHFASRYNHTIVALLLQSGADVNARDNNGATPLHFALSSSLQDISLDGDYDYAEGMLLEGDLKTTELLLERGANVSLRNVLGKTPLEVAPVGERHQIEQLFSQHNQR